MYDISTKSKSLCILQGVRFDRSSGCLLCQIQANRGNCTRSYFLLCFLAHSVWITGNVWKVPSVLI